MRLTYFTLEQKNREDKIYMCMTTMPKAPSKEDIKIWFTFEGRKYSASYKMYEADKVVLPEGTLVEVNGWKETYPPKPITLKRVVHNLYHLDPATIAKKFGTVLAKLDR